MTDKGIRWTETWAFTRKLARWVCFCFGHRPFQETSTMGYCLRCGRVFEGYRGNGSVALAPFEDQEP